MLILHVKCLGINLFGKKKIQPVTFAQMLFLNKIIAEWNKWNTDFDQSKKDYVQLGLVEINFKCIKESLCWFCVSMIM